MAVEWIKTEDRLPECDKSGWSNEVLVYSSKFDVISKMRYSKKSRVFMDEFDSILQLSNVSHWMPLPKPPKEEEK